jgi:hypothetical protein
LPPILKKNKKLEGDLCALKNETSIRLEFTYDIFGVGTFNNESEYVQKKREEYNSKQSGNGDKWAGKELLSLH